MNKRQLSSFSLLLMLCLLLANVARAGAQYGGYFSQGLVYSPDNPFYDNSTGTSLDYRELGLTGGWQVNTDLRFAGQFLSRKVGDLDDGSPQIDFLLMDYSFLSLDDVSAGIRVGRVKTPYGIYNRTRDVPHARPGVFVPQSVYFETFRDALLSADGGNLYLNLRCCWGDLGIDLIAGTAHIDNNVVEYQAYQQNINGRFEEVDISGFKIAYSPAVLSNLNIGFSLLDVSTELDNAARISTAELQAGVSDLLDNPQNFVHYITATRIEPMLKLFSLQYNWRNWVFTSEYLEVAIKMSDLEVLYFPLEAVSANLQGYYAQTEWMPSDKLSLYARYEHLVYDTGDRDGEAFAVQTGGNPVTQYNEAVTVGARWYFNPDFSLTGEWSWNQGAAFINGPDNIDYQALQEDWDFLVLQLSYHF
ncbi:hypothetical protein [Halioxenophilus sp. WMMB6]|uniref:hypothetical protein n=1 Tax=Halioxenophilus sp. WMMB6 TaxID=3073815 RepID=UPI00295E51AB|nr:hypothetical protein [Halioxenophilus sp. WMMB6]